MQRGGGGVAGQDDHGDPGQRLPQPYRGLQAGHAAGQVVVRQHQVRPRRTAGHQVQRRRAVGRDGHDVAFTLQQQTKQLLHVRVVLNHQEGGGAADGLKSRDAAGD